MGKCLAFSLLIGVGLLALDSAAAQDSDEERRQQRRLRDDTRREEWRQKFDVEKYIREQDDNKDGIVAPEEIKRDRTRRFLQQLGINVSKATPVETLVKNYKDRYRKETEAKRKEFEKKLSTLDSFGVAPTTQGVADFGVEVKPTGIESFNDRATGLKASDFNPDQMKRAEKLVSTFDRDKNGFLDGDEIARITWGKVPPESSDVNRDGRLSKLELAQRFQQIEETRSKKKTDNQSEESRRASSDDQRDGDRNRRGRDQRSRENRFSTSASRGSNRANTTAAAKNSVSEAQKYENYVNSTFEKYDVNQDGKLDQKELTKTRLFRKAIDENKDGVLDKREAIAFVSGAQKSKSQSRSKRKSAGSSMGNSTRDSESSSTSFGRNDRKPLADVDRNQDGQIQMHEFSEVWTAETLEQFRAKDKNGDGILSSSEWK